MNRPTGLVAFLLETRATAAFAVGDAVGQAGSAGSGGAAPMLRTEADGWPEA